MTHLKNLLPPIPELEHGFVAGDDADHNGSTTAGDFTVNSATGLITAKTGRLDFENPNDVGGTDHDNSYLITMTYTSSTNNKIYRDN